MKPPLNNIKLSNTARDQLIKLKRITKIEHWNVLCRWGFCRSLAEASIPSPIPIPADSNIELTWQVFSGQMSDIFILALKQRCHQDGLGIDQETLAHQFRLHLHRGIGYLAGDPKLKKIDDLIKLCCQGGEQLISNK
ncbi:MAG: DNA sulfur modification protein DndE [Spirulinaceae cyanobacterium]